MPPHLRAPDGRIVVITAPMRVGRDPACEIHLSDSRASRVHATVWPEGAVVCVRDEGSSNGTFVNEHRMPPGEVFGLSPGDQFRIGDTIFIVEAATAIAAGVAQPAVPAPAASAPPSSGPVAVTERMPAPMAQTRRRSALPLLAAGGCAGLLVIVLCGASGWLAVQRPPFVQTALAGLVPGQQGTPGPVTVAPEEIRLTILAESSPSTPVSADTFAANQPALAAAVAELNLAQLDLIRRALAQAAAGPARVSRPAFQFQTITDDDFALIGQNAIKVAVLAQQQSAGLAAQGGGNDPAAEAMATAYATLAQQALALTVKVDALRNDWAAGTAALADVAARLADYSSAIWNPAVTDPGVAGNPFAALAGDPSAVANPTPLTPESLDDLLNQLDDPDSTLGWLAIAPATGDETLTLPTTDAPAGPDQLAGLIAADPPADLGALAQAAGDALAAWAAPGAPTAGTITIPKVAVVVADPSADGQPLPVFPGGQAVVISTSGDANDLAGTLLGLDGNSQPTVNGQTPIAGQPPVVTLTLSNLTIESITRHPAGASTFEAEVVYSFDVQWSTNLAAPRLELDCAGGNHFAITATSGSQRVSAKGLLILYPGAEDAYCYASRNGNTLGSALTRFLVGDAAEATQRALQVETDAAALDLTLTAEVAGTQAVQQTQAGNATAVKQTEQALSTEVAGTQAAEAAITATHLAANADRFATQTQAALSNDSDGDGVSDANDRCTSQAETRNGWRDEDGCADTLPTMNIVNGAFAETLTNAPVNAFSTIADLVINFAAGTVDGTLTGSASWTDSYFCVNTSDPSEIFETVTADYDASYSADVLGTADGTASTYTGDLLAAGVTNITLTQQFTHEECTHLNSANLDDDWSGEGVVSGTWDGNTFGTLATDWAVDDIEVAGQWSGTITLTE